MKEFIVVFVLVILGIVGIVWIVSYFVDQEYNKQNEYCSSRGGHLVDVGKSHYLCFTKDGRLIQ